MGRGDRLVGRGRATTRVAPTGWEKVGWNPAVDGARAMNWEVSVIKGRDKGTR